MNEFHSNRRRAPKKAPFADKSKAGTHSDPGRASFARKRRDATNEIEEDGRQGNETCGKPFAGKTKAGTHSAPERASFARKRRFQEKKGSGTRRKFKARNSARRLDDGKKARASVVFHAETAETGLVSRPRAEDGAASPMNLTKYLSTSGVASRRACAELIRSGRVSFNGEIQTNPGTRVGHGDQVEVDGRPVKPERKLFYVMLNKPRGYVCTAEDRHAAKKALDLIDFPGAPRLVSAGRLDKNSEGLLLFSNDGDWIEQLTHPRHRIRKVYRVTTDFPLTPEQIAALTGKGIESEGEILRADVIREDGPGRWLFVLSEGKNREIRRMLEGIGNRTRRLQRIAVGALRLGALPIGKWRFLSEGEVESAKKSPEIEARKAILRKKAEK